MPRTCWHSRPRLPDRHVSPIAISVPTIVVASSARKTARGRWLLRGTAAFILLWVIVANEVLQGVPIEGQPSRWVVFGVGFAPFVLVYAALLRDNVARRLGLIEALPARAAIDGAGVTLTIDGKTLPVIPWTSVAALQPSGREWQLVASDGSKLATIPAELMYPRPSWTDAPSFAEVVVQMRPDRYALRGKRFEAGLTEFSIRRPEDVVGRPSHGVQKRVLAVGIVLAVVAFVLLIATTPTG